MSEQRPVVSPAEKHNITRVCHMSHTRDTGALKAGAKCAGLYTATAKDNTMRATYCYVCDVVSAVDNLRQSVNNVGQHRWSQSIMWGETGRHQYWRFSQTIEGGGGGTYTVIQIQIPFALSQKYASCGIMQYLKQYGRQVNSNIGNFPRQLHLVFAWLLLWFAWLLHRAVVNCCPSWICKLYLEVYLN